MYEVTHQQPDCTMSKVKDAKDSEIYIHDSRWFNSGANHNIHKLIKHEHYSLSWQKSNKMAFPGECSRIQGRSTVLSQINEGGSIIIIFFYNSGHKINCPTMVKFHSSFQE